MKEETKALYEIANAIDRLTLVVGHSHLAGLAKGRSIDEKLEEARERLDWSFVDSGMFSAMCDAENAISYREQDGKAYGGHIADIVKNG